MTARVRTFAVYAITRHGARVAARIAAALGDADVFLSEKVATSEVDDGASGQEIAQSTSDSGVFLRRLAPSEVDGGISPRGTALSETDKGIPDEGMALSETDKGIPDGGTALSEADDAIPRREMAPAAPNPPRRFALPMGPLLEETFARYDAHIFVISVGAVTRMIAPLLRDKKTDPAVVCVDDAARFAVCVLSGHIGRGNAFAERVAQALGAEPVITTASDALGTLTADILGRDLGWSLDDPERNVTRVCAAVVNEAPVLFVQETGEPSWWPEERALPKGVAYATSLDGVEPAAWEALLIASHRDVARTHPACFERAVVYRPKSLVVGVGCDRGAPLALIERGIRAVLREHGLCEQSVRALATVDAKGDEPALLALCEARGWRLMTFPAQVLDALGAAEGVERPSERVKCHVGTRGVSEPAALLAAGAARLLVPKQKYTEPGVGRTMTVAVAEIPFSKRRDAGAGLSPDGRGTSGTEARGENPAECVTERSGTRAAPACGCTNGGGGGVSGWKTSRRAVSESKSAHREGEEEHGDTTPPRPETRLVETSILSSPKGISQGGSLLGPPCPLPEPPPATTPAPAPAPSLEPAPAPLPRERAPGSLAIVGIGPGDFAHATSAALEAIAGAEVVVGYATYLRLVGPLLDGKEVVRTGMTEEIGRARAAVERARAGARVAIVSSGDAGVYGMASLVFEVLREAGWRAGEAPAVRVIPGVTALSACASRVGAPLGHDFCAISLSDLLTPWALIERRLRAAAEADFVVGLYNPASGRRTRQIARAREILLEHRAPTTPVALVKSAYREREARALTDLEHLLDEEIGMLTTVIVGSSRSYVFEGHMITPRGYTEKYTPRGDALPGQAPGRALVVEPAP